MKFNFFSKTETRRKMVATIEKIHSEFDSASEKLLKEAKAIIAKNNKADKGERLKALGFAKAAPVKQALENIIKKHLSEKIEYYQTYYPNNKFITEELVKQICKKYGLVFGNVNAYIGDMPEKNLQEAESFKLRNEDMEIDSPRYFEKRNSASYGDIFIPVEFKTPYYGIGGNHWFQSRPLDTVISYKRKPFMICAPEKDFDMREMQVLDGYKLKYDPIVLQPVDMGYLIVTKWGLEGDDESLVNEKFN